MVELDPAVENRILTALNHEEPDRVPIWDYIDNRAVLEYFAPGETDLTAAMKKVYAGLGIDLCRGFGAAYSEDQNQETAHSEGEWRVTGQTNWRTNYPIENLEDLAAYESEPVDENWLSTHWVDWVRGMQKTFAPHTMFVPGGGCGFHSTYALMGQALFSYAIYDAPSDIERILEVNTESAVRFARAAAREKLGPIYFIGDDVAYKNGLMFSPDFLRRTFIRSLARTIEPLKAAGMKVIFHSDGNVMEILDDMLDAGIDGLNPIEPIAGMDIGYLKRHYGGRLVLVGNVDCSQVLPLGTVEDVVRATKECLRAAAPGGGHFIGSSSEIVPATPLQNVLAFYEACHRYGTYPISC